MRAQWAAVFIRNPISLLSLYLSFYSCRHKLGVSDECLAGPALGDVALAREHGLAHAAHVRPAHVLAAVHLAVRDHPLPRVGPIALRLDLVVVGCLLLLVSPLAEVHLLGPLPLPL